METLQTQLTETTFLFPRLFKALKSEHNKRLADFINEIKLVNKREGLDTWFYNDLLPKGKNVSAYTIEQLKDYLIERKTKQIEKAIQRDLDRLQAVEKAGIVNEITVSIEWKKSQMWGSNPNANARCHTSKGFDIYNSGSIGGCGYDKQSTAVANCVNQCNAVLKAMYLVKEKKVKMNNRDLFGYGSGYGILPQLEGGVGVSCYPQIFKKIGLKFTTTASGKTFDVYYITK